MANLPNKRQRRQRSSTAPKLASSSPPAMPYLAVFTSDDVWYVTENDEINNELVAKLEAPADQPNATVTVHVNHILEFEDGRRLQFIDLFASLNNVQFAGPTGPASGLLDALGQLVRFDASNLDRSDRGRKALIEAAAICHGNQVDVAAQAAADRLRSAGFRAIRVAELRREIQLLRRQLVHAATNAAPADDTAVISLLPDAPVSGQVIVPKGWQIGPDGILRVGDQLAAPVPIIICEVGRDERSGRETIGLAWRHGQDWSCLSVNRGVIADPRRLVELADNGFPANANNARQLVDYLAAFEHENRNHLPRVSLHGRLGWTPGYAGFLWGETLIIATDQDETANATSRFRGADAGDEQIAKGYRAGGSLDQWMAVIAQVKECPVPLFCLYAALVPPLAPIIGALNFVISVSGSTSTGKTTTARIVASVWGDPGDGGRQSLMHNWNSTRVFRDRCAAINGNLPTIVDETKLAPKPEEVARLIYAFAEGHARARGTIRGLDAMDPIQGVLFVTGEQTAASFTNDGGTTARIIEFWGKPFGQGRKVVSGLQKVNRGITAHFGHAGPAFVRFILAHRSDWPAWRQRYLDLVKKYVDRAAGHVVAGRLANHFAAVDLASLLFHDAVKLPWPWRNPCDEVYAIATREVLATDRPAEALRHLLSVVMANRHHFTTSAGEGGFDRQPGVCWGRWIESPPMPPDAGSSRRHRHLGVGIYPHIVEQILDEKGYGSEAIIRQWHERSWILVDPKDSRHHRTMRILGDPCKVVFIPQRVIAAFQGAANQE